MFSVPDPDLPFPWPFLTKEIPWCLECLLCYSKVFRGSELGVWGGCP